MWIAHGLPTPTDLLISQTEGTACAYKVPLCAWSNEGEEDVDSLRRCVSLVIRPSACETSPRARGMMRVINSTKSSEAATLEFRRR
jgi:hypothetical protein